jgi:hypothetical protein
MWWIIYADFDVRTFFGILIFDRNRLTVKKGCAAY